MLTVPVNQNECSILGGSCELQAKQIRAVQRTRNNKVKEIWKQPFERGKIRNEKDWYYFLQFGGEGKEYVEYDKEMYDSIRSSKLGEGWEHLICTFDPKNVTFKRI